MVTYRVFILWGEVRSHPSLELHIKLSVIKGRAVGEGETVRVSAVDYPPGKNLLINGRGSQATRKLRGGMRWWPPYLAAPPPPHITPSMKADTSLGCIHLILLQL